MRERFREETKLTRFTQKAIAHAFKEAEAQNRIMDSGDLLLGLLSVRNSLAAYILNIHGVDLPKTRKGLVILREEIAERSSESRDLKLSHEAETILEAASIISQLEKSGEITTEQLLKAVILAEGSLSHKIFRSLAVTPSKIGQGFTEFETDVWKKLLKAKQMEDGIEKQQALMALIKSKTS